MPWDDDSDYWDQYWENELGPWESKLEIICATCTTPLTLEISEWEDRPGFREPARTIGLDCPVCDRPSGYEYDVEHSSVTAGRKV